MVSSVLAPVLQALYSAEVDVSIISQWDAGWSVELRDRLGGIADRRFDDGELDKLEAWLRIHADNVAPGWRALDIP